MRFPPLERLERNAKRLGEIVGVLAKYGLADWLKGISIIWLQDRLRSVDGQQISALKTGERVRLAFTELGPSFIKLGQLLSTRADLVGPDVARELTRLQADTPADSPESVRATITAELGRPPEEIFAEFDPVPMASASIAQVHRARLHSGESVVVKVQHAGIENTITPDLEIVGGLAELAEKHAPQLRLYRPVDTVRQFRRSLTRELNFHYELQNLETFNRHFRQDETVRFPRPYRDVSAKRVLTMEQFHGIQGSDTASLAQADLDRNAFARHGANIYLEMIFRDSFFHADPHPGNLMLLPGDVVGILDCGMAGHLDEDLREDIESLLMAVFENDAEQLTDAVLRLGEVPEDCPRDRLRTDLEEFLIDYVNRPLADLDIAAALNGLVEIIHRYWIALPSGFLLLLRTLVLLEGTSRLLSPDFSLAEIMRPFYLKTVRRRFAPKKIATKLRRTYRDWNRLLGALPRDLGDVLARLRNGTFRVHLDHRHLDPVVNRLVLGILTAAVFLGSSLLWSMKAPPMIKGVSVFGAAGYMLSVYMGWRLYRAVKKSGDVSSKD